MTFGFRFLSRFVLYYIYKYIYLALRKKMAALEKQEMKRQQAKLAKPRKKELYIKFSSI